MLRQIQRLLDITMGSLLYFNKYKSQNQLKFLKSPMKKLQIISMYLIIYVCVWLVNPKNLNIPLKIMIKHRGQLKMSNQMPLRHTQYLLRQHTLGKNLRNHHSNLHALHFAEAYSLQAEDMFFGLLLKVQGLPYLMSIDTGSSDFLIKGKGTSGEPKKKYSCKKCIQTRPHYEIGYLDGDLDTYETSLQVSLGYHKFNQSILVAYHTSNDNFKDDDGILGLSYQKLARNPNPNFISTLISNNIISQYAFGVNLNFKNKENSVINFGNYDENLFQGELGFFDIESSHEYMIGVKGISIGDSKKDKEKIMEIDQGLLDTGNTCLSIPDQYEQEILERMEKTSNGKSTGNKCYFQVEQNIEMFSLMLCRVTNFEALPDFNIHIGEEIYSIPKEFYLQQCSKKAQEDRRRYHDQAWYCQTYIESVRNMNQVILGDAFFTRFYTYFDLGAKKIGIAQNREQIDISVVQSNFKLEKKDWGLLFPEDQQNSSESFSDEFQATQSQNSFASFFKKWLY